VEVIYHVQAKGCGPRSVNLNGVDLPFTRAANAYRLGAAEVPIKEVQERLGDSDNRLNVYLG
jgi:hypothetical protein